VQDAPRAARLAAGGYERRKHRAGWLMRTHRSSLGHSAPFPVPLSSTASRELPNEFAYSLAFQGGWPNCKTFIPDSNPGGASNSNQQLSVIDLGPAGPMCTGM
jgi:hypothetical protein